jgi:hypothetical protein
MEGSEDFWLQVNDGDADSWVNVAEWAHGLDSNNGAFYHKEVEIVPGTPFSLTSNLQLRFRCDASGIGDLIYIDDVKISGWN